MEVPHPRCCGKGRRAKVWRSHTHGAVVKDEGPRCGGPTPTVPRLLRRIIVSSEYSSYTRITDSQIKECVTTLYRIVVQALVC